MRTCNPLSVDELGRSAALALMGYEPSVLPPDEHFNGAGVYTIHYDGPFPAYADMGNEQPIYVGKAEPSGKRQGRTSARRSSPVLYKRLAEHAGSIRESENLDLDDFRRRWLVLDPIWIGLTEQVMIAQYRPIWNVVVDGFGLHDPGKTRRSQQRSRWDTLHPGRLWAAEHTKREEGREDILAATKAHRTERGMP